jgi:membrane-associated phospholipid phosphatase
MKFFCLRHRSYFLPFFVIWAVLGILQLMFTQNFLILFVNKHWTPHADIFFRHFTHVGDGTFILIAGLLGAFFSYRLCIKIFLSFAISGIGVQFFKSMVFSQIHRPPRILSKLLPLLHQVEGVKLHYFHSFPSGHTTSAFALFTVLALECKSSALKPFFLIPPLLVAYSRMYLLAHFLGDVYVAAFVGIPISALIYFYMNQYWESQSNPKLNGGLAQLF